MPNATVVTPLHAERVHIVTPVSPMASEKTAMANGCPAAQWSYGGTATGAGADPPRHGSQGPAQAASTVAAAGGHGAVMATTGSLSKEFALSTLDSIATFVLIGVGTVSYWRGTWNVLDIYLYPHDPALSAWASIGIAAAIILSCHALRKPLEAGSARLAGPSRAVLERLFTYFAGWGVVCSWRGIWNVWNLYVLVDDPAASAWLAHAVGVGILLALLSLRCIYAPPGVVMMDDEEGGFALETLRSYWVRRERNGQRVPFFGTQRASATKGVESAKTPAVDLIDVAVE